MKQLTYNYYENAHPSSVVSQLKGFVTKRAMHPKCRYFYIGQTYNPQSRLTQHQGVMRNKEWSEWTHMEVIFGHQSAGFVTQVESELISHGASIINPQHKDSFFNISIPPADAKNEYSVYVLIDKDNRTNDNSLLDKNTVNCSKVKSLPSSRQRTDALKSLLEQTIKETAAKYIYVGFTSSPERRIREHQKVVGRFSGGDWDMMRVLYTTSSLTRALEVETRLFEHAKVFFGHDRVLTSVTRALHDGRLPFSYVYYLEERL